MITTTNFNFKKLEMTDAADITATNPNWDKLDEELLKCREVFIAEADVTSFEEIQNAVDEGKIVFCKYLGTILSLIRIERDYGCVFSGSILQTSGVEFCSVMVMPDGWGFSGDKIFGYNYGTDDLTENESQLSTGTLYFVYE